MNTKRFYTIKFKITLWYTMFMMAFIFLSTAILYTFSFQMAVDNVENSLKAQVAQASEKINVRRHRIGTDAIADREEFKNVSIYDMYGNYITGQYIYDMDSIEFKDEVIQRADIGDNTYIVYDMLKKVRTPGYETDLWIRGSASVSSLNIFENSVFKLILIMAPIMLVLAAAGGYIIIKKLFTPINEIIETSNDIYERNDISKRIPVNTDSVGDELQLMSITLNRMLEKIERLILREKQFTSDASHELRTPVSVILSQAEYIAEITDSEKERELAQTIIVKANQMSELISKLLLLARIDSKKQPLNNEQIDLAEIIELAADEMRPFAEEKHIEIKTHILSKAEMSADEALIFTMIKNLISNAIKYGRENGSVTITLCKTDNIEISVCDNGIGISEEHIEKIWERFYRADSARSDEYGSNGLGLAMVKSIAELYNGSVCVESKINKGTKFKIIFKN